MSCHAHVDAPPSHPDVFARQAAQAKADYQSTGSVARLADAIQLQQKAIDLSLKTSQLRSPLLTILISYTYEMYAIAGFGYDLDRVIVLQRAMVLGTSLNNSCRGLRSRLLGLWLSQRYYRSRNLQDLDDAIRYLKEALVTVPHDHKGRVTFVYVAASLLKSRFLRCNQRSDIDLALEYYDLAVTATQAKSKSLTTRLYGMGKTYRLRYLHYRAPADIDAAIAILKKARNIDVRLSVECELTASLIDSAYLHKSEVLLRDACSRAEKCLGVLLQQGAQVDGARFAYQLSLGYRSLHKITGRLEPLNEAIGYLKTALDYLKPEHDARRRYFVLSEMASSFNDRFIHTTSIDDLCESTKLWRACEPYQETEGQRYEAQTQLSLGLSLLYRRRGCIADLDDANRFSSMALAGRSGAAVKDASTFFGIATNHLREYIVTRARDELQQALHYYEESVGCSQFERGNQVKGPSAVAQVLLYMHKITPLTCLAERAIGYTRHVLKKMASNDHERGSALMMLGEGFLLKSKDSVDADTDRNDACKAYRAGLEHTSAPPFVRIQCGYHATRILCEYKEWPTAAQVIEHSIDLLPLVTLRSLSNDDLRYIAQCLSEISSLAATTSLQAGRPPLDALQLLERSRGVIINLALDLRIDIPSLEAVDIGLALKYRQRRDAVASHKQNIQLSHSTPNNQSVTDAAFAVADRQRRRDIQDLEDVIKEARQRLNTDKSSLSLQASEIFELARAGPLINLSVTRFGSHAIIVHDSEVEVITLPNFSDQSLSYCLRNLARGNSDRRDGNPKLDMIEGVLTPQPAPVGLSKVMECVWRNAVGLVLEKLGLMSTKVSPLPHIWWVGGGQMSLLPLHAAGTYGHELTENAMSRVVSSYVPSMRALQHARQRRPNPLYLNRIVVVAMRHTPGYEEDLQIDDEVSSIQQYASGAQSVDVLENPTVADMLLAIQSCDFVHFAGHGACHATNPLLTALIVGSQQAESLTVDSLLSLNNVSASVAYLAACSTAEVRSRQLTQEGLHLASAFQLAGFKHVIGTLWGVDDHVAARVATEFYRGVTKPGLDSSHDVGRALHTAVTVVQEELTSDADRALTLWAPMIHVGP